MRRKIVLFVFAVAFLSGCTKSGSSEMAAEFKLQDLDGKTVSLSSFKGKPVLIDFWATWCPPCREAVPAIEKIHKSYAAKGLVVLGVSMDQGGWDSVKAFVSDYRMSYLVLKGTDEVISDYQVRTIPMVVLLNKEGKIVKRYLGFGGEEELEKDIMTVL